MATEIEYRNILLKDNGGNVLLPITLSYYVEYKDGISVKSYLDSLGNDVEYAKSYIDTINDKLDDHDEFKTNITQALNEVIGYFGSYIAKPDYASNVVFDNNFETHPNLSSELTGLTPNSYGYVSTQAAIEALDGRVTSVSAYTYVLSNDIETIKSDISALEDYNDSQDERITTISNKTDYSYARVNDLFDDQGNLDITAYNVKYTPNVDAGTESLSVNNQNVQKAIDLLGAKIKQVEQTSADIAYQAGVTSVTGSQGVLVNNVSNAYQTGAVTVSLNLDNNKVIIDNGEITVDDSKLSIAGSQITGYISADQIEGGLGADNINITYIDNSGAEPVEASKTVQEFYDETQTTLSTIQSTVNNLDNDYILSITDDGGENSSYARVYTFKQGANGTTYTINIPKDQFLKNVEYTTYEGSYALVFTWQLGDDDETTDAPTTYIPISAFVEEITSEIVTEVGELSDRVDAVESSISTIESTYITGATINGETVNVVDNVLQLSYNILYVPGNRTETLSTPFLSANGITIE